MYMTVVTRVSMNVHRVGSQNKVLSSNIMAWTYSSESSTDEGDFQVPYGHLQWPDEMVSQPKNMDLALNARRGR